MDPVSIIRRYHDALNAYDPAVVGPMLAPEATYHSPSVGVIVGRDAIIKAMTGYFAEYPDQVAVDDTIELLPTRQVRCAWRLKATSKTTGEAYVRRGIEIDTIDSNGLILKVEVQDL